MFTFCSTDGSIAHTCANEGADCSAVVECPNAKWVGIEVDRCVMKDLRIIWEAGISTVCCCCGHGSVAAFICVSHADREKMIDLGYREMPLRYEHCAECGAFFAPKHMGGACEP